MDSPATVSHGRNWRQGTQELAYRVLPRSLAGIAPP